MQTAASDNARGPAAATPLVSIGVPVYNEERFLDCALQSLLAQDYPQVEIVLSDNASTDATLAIAHDAAHRDARVRVLRAPVNTGAIINFQRCLDAAHGELFMWAAGHDLWSPNLVTRCVDTLTCHRSAVVAVPDAVWIDSADQPLPQSAGTLDTRGLDPLARAFMLLWANMHPMYGLMRTQALRSTGPIPNYPGADLILLLRMVLQGDVVPASGAVWSRRITRADEDFQGRQKRYGSSEFGMRSHRLNRLMPLVRLPYEILRAVWGSTLSVSDKLAFSVALPTMLPARYKVGRRRVI